MEVLAGPGPVSTVGSTIGNHADPHCRLRCVVWLASPTFKMQRIVRRTFGPAAEVRGRGASEIQMTLEEEGGSLVVSTRRVARPSVRAV